MTSAECLPTLMAVVEFPTISPMHFLTIRVPPSSYWISKIIQNHISLGQVMQAAYAYNDLRNGTELAQQSSTSRYIIIYNEQNAGISTKAAQVADDSHLTLIPWADKVSIDRLKLA
ncbi:hypothetical protein N219_00570 [Limosilactobacillus fermentum MTCC 8711]|nr:hypothetical protein N219_00570 [Limosilactobacillus fermentum MTCC 8711]